MEQIVIFTRQYPYTNNSENFLDAELSVVDKKYSITVVPFSKQIQSPLNKYDITISDSCCNSSLLFKVFVLKDMLLSNLFWRCFFYDGFWKINGFWKKVYYLKNLYGSFFIKRIVYKKKIDYNQNTVFYSYWLTYAPLGLCMLKAKGFISNKIVSRTHGYEIYEEKEEKGLFLHYPFRNLTYSIIDEVYSISDYGASLLKSKYPTLNDKFKVSKLGVSKQLPHKPLLLRELPFTVVSCSYLYLLKRVDLIFYSLCNYCIEHKGVKVHWLHIGTSRGEKDELSFDSLKEIIKIKPDNLQVSLLGRIDNKEIGNIYKKNNCNLFVNLSTTEGIPVSIMEALSMSIPVIATNVGGTSEIVNSETGYLLDVNFSQKNFNIAMDYIFSNYEELCKTIPVFFNQNYCMENNYIDFYSKIAKK